MDYGAIVVTLTGSPVISGDGARFAAVEPASAFGHTGFPAARIRVVDGVYLIEDINWYAP